MLGSSPTARCHRFKRGLACRRPGAHVSTRLNVGCCFFCPSERTPLLMLLLIHVIVLFFFLMILTCFHLPPKTPNDINIKGIFRSIYKFHPFAGTDLGAISNSHSGLSQGEEFHLLKACDGEGPSNGRHASVLLVRGQQSNSNCPCENQPQSPLQPPGLDRANKPSNQNPAFMTSKVSGSNWTLYRWSQRGRANARLRFVASNLRDVFVQTFLGLENKTIMTFSLLRTNWPEAHCCYKTSVK